jgi:hypothetical protein
MTTLGFDVSAGSPASFAAVIARGLAQIGQIVKFAGIRPE